MGWAGTPSLQTLGVPWEAIGAQGNWRGLELGFGGYSGGQT